MKKLLLLTIISFFIYILFTPIISTKDLVDKKYTKDVLFADRIDEDNFTSEKSDIVTNYIISNEKLVTNIGNARKSTIVLTNAKNIYIKITQISLNAVKNNKLLSSAAIYTYINRIRGDTCTLLSVSLNNIWYVLEESSTKMIMGRSP